MVAILLGADNGFFYAGQIMHFSSPFTVFLIYHKHFIATEVLQLQLFQNHTFSNLRFILGAFFQILYYIIRLMATVAIRRQPNITLDVRIKIRCVSASQVRLIYIRYYLDFLSL